MYSFQTREQVFKGFMEQLAREKGRIKICFFITISKKSLHNNCRATSDVKGVSPNVDFSGCL